MQPASHAVDVLTAGVGEQRAAVADLLEGAQLRADRASVLRERSLLGADAVVQPGEHVDIIGEASAELLAGVAVRVDERRADADVR